MLSPSVSERLVNLVLTAWLGLDGLSPLSSRIRQLGTYGKYETLGRGYDVHALLLKSSAEVVMDLFSSCARAGPIKERNRPRILILMITRLVGLP